MSWIIGCVVFCSATTIDVNKRRPPMLSVVVDILLLTTVIRRHMRSNGATYQMRREDATGATMRPLGSTTSLSGRVVLVCMASDRRNMSLPLRLFTSPARRLMAAVRTGRGHFGPGCLLVSSVDDVIDACALVLSTGLRPLISGYLSLVAEPPGDARRLIFPHPGCCNCPLLVAAVV